MRYITGIHALNIPCRLDTCGDWHWGALQWKNIQYGETETSIFGDTGIEEGKEIPNNAGRYAVADHVRACLDLIERGDFANAQGMRDAYISNNKYTEMIFHNVYKLKDRADWKRISDFMGREYRMQWIRFLQRGGKCGN